MIPARYAASRFPGKLMKTLGNKSVILHTHDNTLATGLFDEVWVVTDSDVIYKEISSHGGHAKMSVKEHESGSDRIAEAVENMDVDIIVNVQGDTPFVQKEALKQLIDLFKDSFVQVASMMRPLKEKELIENPNLVKVVVNKNMDSLLFSRSVIPYPRNTQINIMHHEHIGIYAFTKKALLNFTKWPVTPLEDAEKIECLRFLEHGIPLRMTAVDYQGVGIDTPEDLKRAVELL
ncbi:MAG: 3-deoxy-manno-octulosonate cytidylyltransferase [Chitinophagaceae bacterium]|nr:3-deoxy-manno-octulosonate cytidylyltransferase [Chitinophagaceae bacterium]